MAELTQQRLKELLHYDPETGHFTWLVRRNAHAGCVMPGDRAGYQDPNGYRVINTHGRPQKEHRLVWLYLYGDWPAGEIDHANCDPGDNRLANLRIATKSQNAANKARAKRAASGLKGAYRGKAGRWFSHIAVNKRLVRLGRFDTAEEAHAAYVEAARKYYGEFARAG